MKSFLTEVKGFTPLIDVLVQELGLVPAGVYGIVWRYCQMKDGVCQASLEHIGKRVGISGKTAKRHIVVLCEAGYLEDMTPDLRHKPHIYRDTGKAQIIGLVEARTESPTSEKVGQKVGQKVRLARTESPTRYDRESDLGRTESPIKRVSKRVSKETEEETLQATPADNPISESLPFDDPPIEMEISEESPPHQAYFNLLQKLCKMDANIKANAGRIARGAKALREAGYSLEDIKRLYSTGGWWYKYDFRGQKGESPWPEQIGATILRALNNEQPRAAPADNSMIGWVSWD